MTLPDKNQFKKIRKFGLVLVLGLIMFGCIGYFGIYRPLLIQSEKKNFAQAEKTLAELQSKIIAKLGEPSRVSQDKSCSYIGWVYEKGRLVCGTQIKLLYENQDNQSATSLTNLAATALSANPVHDFSGKPFSAFESSTTHRAEQNPSQDIINIGGVNCSAQYLYPGKYRSGNPFPSTDKDNLQISLSCSSETTSPIYPLEK